MGCDVPGLATRGYLDKAKIGTVVGNPRLPEQGQNRDRGWQLVHIWTTPLDLLIYIILGYYYSSSAPVGGATVRFLEQLVSESGRILTMEHVKF